MSADKDGKESASLQDVGFTSSSDAKDVKVVSISSESLSDSDSHRFGTGDVFAQGGQIQFYEPIPEYEGRHRYDPTAQWTEAEEKKLVRKVRVNSYILPNRLSIWFRWLGSRVGIMFSHIHIWLHNNDHTHPSHYPT